jgi:uncharacterized radical SAM protein YgiQ
MRDIRGTAYVAGAKPGEGKALPPFEEVTVNPDAYNEAFRLAAAEANAFAARPLYQRHGERWVVVNAPSLPLAEAELDSIYALSFTKLPHPSYTEAIPAYEQIRFSITTHRGCFGGCAFCAIGQHQGKFIQSRSEASVLAEVERLTRHPHFRGTVTDVGGPTANMYGLSCGDAAARSGCRRTGCLYPRPCRHLVADDSRAVRLLRKLRNHRGIRHAYVASGVRYDLLEHQQEYFEELLTQHVGGLLKVAPESVCDAVTQVMRKPGPQLFEAFLRRFRDESCRLGLRQGIVPYFISAHPGCTVSDMVDVALFLKRHHLRVEQVQEFTPTPGTLSTCIYFTGRDPFTGASIHVPRTVEEKRLQKALLLWHLPENRRDLLKALAISGREEDGRALLGSAGRRKGEK